MGDITSYCAEVLADYIAYTEEAREICSFNNLSNTYNDFFVEALDQKYLVSADIDQKHRLMKLKEVNFTPLVIQERKIQDEKIYNVSSKYLFIKVWDDERVDGDTISINFNGKWILKNHHLSKEKKTILLPLKENQENEIIFHAVNLGEEPPNTAAVRLEYDNGIEKEFNMRSDFDSNGIIKIIHNNN